MTTIARIIPMRGALVAKVIRARRAPLSWRLKNALRRSYLSAWAGVKLAKLFSKITGITTATAELAARVIRADGTVINYGVLSHRMITDDGVGYLVDAWDARAVNLEDMNYHGCGTDNTAEAQSDSALGTECTSALNPDNTRGDGTRSQPSANIYRSIATLTFDASATVTEHGIFNQSATGGGTLWDRSVFAAINVANGDSIQFTYSLTVNAGG